MACITKFSIINSRYNGRDKKVAVLKINLAILIYELRTTGVSLTLKQQNCNLALTHNGSIATLDAGSIAEMASAPGNARKAPKANIRSIANLHRFPSRFPLSFPAGNNSMERRLAAIQTIEVVEYARLTRAGEEQIGGPQGNTEKR